MTHNFGSDGLMILVLLENARRINARAEKREVAAVEIRVRAGVLTREGEEWRDVAEDPTHKRNIALVEEATGLYGAFLRDAATARREAERLESQARRLRDHAVEYTRKAKQANEKYLAEAKQANKYARMAARSTTPAENRQIDRAVARQLEAEQRRAKRSVGALFSAKATRAAAQAAAA